MSNQRLLKVRDVMERCGVSERTIRFWIAQRGMPHILLDKKTLRIPEADLEKWIARHEDTRSTVARFRLLSWALQRSEALTALVQTKPASVFYWATGQVPALSIDGVRLSFTPEALKQWCGVADDTLVIAPAEAQEAKHPAGAPSAYSGSRAVKAS